MKKTLFRFIIIVTSILFLAGTSWAWEKPKSFKGVEFLTGFSQAKLRVKGNLRTIPLIAAFDFDLKPLVEKTGLKYWGLFQFQIEPFIAPIYQPEGNIEIGNYFAFKIGFLPEGGKFQPYGKVAAGFDYMSQRTREQGTQFNFVEYGGVGMHYFFKKNIAFTVEYRFRHLSNAGIDSPNSGINSHYGLMGIAYQF